MASTINASTSPAAIVQTADGTGILSLQTGNTTAVTIDASQNVGIGTASPTGKLQVNGAGGVSGSTNLVYVNVTSSFGGISVNSTANNNSFIELLEAGTKVGGFNADTTNNVTSLQADGGHALAFNTAGTTERMRIDSNGSVLVNSTSAIRARVGQMQLKASSSQEALTTSSNDLSYSHWVAKSADSGAGTHYLGYFENSSGTNVGQITHNNTNTSYTTSSDYRLKENIVPMTGALDKVALLKPVTYKWKFDGSNSQGFIAHELQEVVPDCVSGEKDAVDEEGNPKYQGVDTSFLVATLTAAIQEQQALITSLTARITALEGASL